MDDDDGPVPGAGEYDDIQNLPFNSRGNDFFLARSRPDATPVVLKHVPRSDEAIREVAALRHIQQNERHERHKRHERNGSIISMFAVHTRPQLGDTTIALEYFPAGDLRAWMDAHKDAPLDSATVLSIVRGMLQAIATCHDCGVVHRDISPRNVLIRNDDTRKGIVSVALADFGCSRLVTSTSPTRGNVGTLWYMAPEVLFGSREYAPQVDVFGVGCIAAELLRKKPLFAGSGQLDQICRLVDTLGTPDASTWPELATLSDWSLLEFPERAPKSPHDIFPDVDMNDPALANLVDLILHHMLTYNPAHRSSANDCLSRLSRTVSDPVNQLN